jgi:hypothetical protein
MRRTFILAHCLLCVSLLAVEPALGETAAFDARTKAVLEAAMANEKQLNGGSPMHYWVAQQLFEQGEKDVALRIVRSGVKAMRIAIEKRRRAATSAQMDFSIGHRSTAM